MTAGLLTNQITLWLDAMTCVFWRRKPDQMISTAVMKVHQHGSYLEPTFGTCIWRGWGWQCRGWRAGWCTAGWAETWEEERHSMADLWGRNPSASDMKHDLNRIASKSPTCCDIQRAEDQLTCHRQPALLRLSFHRMFTLVEAFVMLGHRWEDHLSCRLSTKEFTVFVKCCVEIWCRIFFKSFPVGTAKCHSVSLCYRKCRALQDHNTRWNTEKANPGSLFLLIVL